LPTPATAVSALVNSYEILRYVFSGATFIGKTASGWELDCTFAARSSRCTLGARVAKKKPGEPEPDS
jgi:hypothetical protein